MEELYAVVWVTSTQHLLYFENQEGGLWTGTFGDASLKMKREQEAYSFPRNIIIVTLEEALLDRAEQKLKTL